MNRRFLAGLVSLALLTGCRSAPTSDPAPTVPPPTTTAPENPQFSACLVSDSAGFDPAGSDTTGSDTAGTNAAALAGLRSSASTLGIEMHARRSARPQQYQARLRSMVDLGCDLVMAVGPAMLPALSAVAGDHPDVQFAAIDVPKAYPASANLRPISFDVAQGAFLAGYLAAAQSETQRVGTFAAVHDQPTLAYLDGFAAGVGLFNETNSVGVRLIGWNGRQGLFIGDGEDSGRADPDLAARAATRLIAQGADVILPVVGANGVGALQVAQDADVTAIWTDVDGCTVAPDQCDILLTSVITEVGDATSAVVSDALAGVHGDRRYVGNIVNGGINLAPLSAQVDEDVANRIDELTAGLIDGSVQVG